MIEFAMSTYLATRTAVTNAIGTHLYGSKASQKQNPPFITYEQDGGRKFPHSTGMSRLAEAEIQLTCHGKTYLQAHALYEILRNELDGFSGTWDSTVIRSAMLSTPHNVSEPAPALGNDIGYPAVRGILTVHYFQSIPTLGG